MDNIVVLMLVVSPILQHYIGLYTSVSVNMLVLSMLYCLLKILKNRTINLLYLTPIISILSFEIYKMISYELSIASVAHAIICSVIYISLSQGYINLRLFRLYSKNIAIFSCIIIIVQSIIFYSFGYHLQMVNTNFLLGNAEQWFRGVKTGLISITGSYNGFYRPASIFLEPSHFFIYVFPNFLLILFSEAKHKKINLILMSLGLLCSTSGMGILFLIVSWIIYFSFYSSNRETLIFTYIFRKKVIITYVFLALAFVYLYNEISFIQSTIDRIFVGDKYGNTAISGRTREGFMLLNELSLREWMFGVSTDTNDIKFNLSGFVATIYKYGIIGVVLSYFFYLYSLAKLDIVHKYMAFIILGISFFVAHTHGTFYMLYFSSFLMGGHLNGSKNKM